MPAPLAHLDSPQASRLGWINARRDVQASGGRDDPHRPRAGWCRSSRAIAVIALLVWLFGRSDTGTTRPVAAVPPKPHTGPCSSTSTVDAAFEHLRAELAPVITYLNRESERARRRDGLSRSGRWPGGERRKSRRSCRSGASGFAGRGHPGRADRGAEASRDPRRRSARPGAPDRSNRTLSPRSDAEARNRRSFGSGPAVDKIPPDMQKPVSGSGAPDTRL